MNFLVTSRFKRAYTSLPDEAQGRIKESLRMLAGNMRHPSLHVKKIKGTHDIWECRAGLDYRISFQMVRDYIILRNAGHHDTTLKNP